MLQVKKSHRIKREASFNKEQNGTSVVEYHNMVKSLEEKRRLDTTEEAISEYEDTVIKKI